MLLSYYIHRLHGWRLVQDLYMRICVQIKVWMNALVVYANNYNYAIRLRSDCMLRNCHRRMYIKLYIRMLCILVSFLKPGLRSSVPAGQRDLPSNLWQQLLPPLYVDLIRKQLKTTIYLTLVLSSDFPEKAVSKRAFAIHKTIQTNVYALKLRPISNWNVCSYMTPKPPRDLHFRYLVVASLLPWSAAVVGILQSITMMKMMLTFLRR